MSESRHAFKIINDTHTALADFRAATGLRPPSLGDLRSWFALAVEYEYPDAFTDRVPLALVAWCAGMARRRSTATTKAKAKRTTAAKRTKALTDRQREVMTLYDRLGSTARVAVELKISRQAADTHLRKARNWLDRNIPPTSRSVNARLSLPEDRRGCVNIKADEATC